MTQPPLHKVGRHVVLEGGDTKAMEKPFRHRALPNDARVCHGLFDPAPCGRSAPWPNSAFRARRIHLSLANTKESLEIFEDAIRDWHLTNNAALAALKSSYAYDAAIDIDGCGNKRENFRYTCSAPGKLPAEQSNLRFRGFNRLEETSSLSSIKVLALAGAPVKLNFCDCASAHAYPG